MLHPSILHDHAILGDASQLLILHQDAWIRSPGGLGLASGLLLGPPAWRSVLEVVPEKVWVVDPTWVLGWSHARPFASVV